MELDKLRAETSKGIDALPREGRAPRFDDTDLRSGAIVVRAADLWSLEWLVRIAPSFRLKEGLETSLRGTEVLQRFLRATVPILGAPEDPAIVLGHSYVD